MTQVKNVIKDNYNMMLLNDFLREEIKESGFHRVEVSKTPTGTKITLHVTRPGIVIGRKGAGIKKLTEQVESDFGFKNPQISVEEVGKQNYHLVLCAIEWQHILNVELHSEELLCGHLIK